MYKYAKHAIQKRLLSNNSVTTTGYLLCFMDLYVYNDITYLSTTFR